MQALAFSTANSADHSHSSRISEIILAGDSVQADLTLAMLAHLSHQYKTLAEKNRWLTWICPIHISKGALTNFNFDILGMRILHPKSENQIPKLMQAALSAGTSHTVAVQCTGFSGALYPWLEQAASEGSSNGLIIRPQR